LTSPSVNSFGELRWYPDLTLEIGLFGGMSVEVNELDAPEDELVEVNELDAPEDELRTVKRQLE
jgi:hypothetical protein|tara:strand:- start:189 stop:380 length:192 start_codon:yes stop_codon:yes gene_type:complete